MVVSDASIHNIMGGMESTAGVRLHNHRRKLKQRFDIIKKLGQGTYGKVQLGINKETGQEVAIKTIKKAKIETEADLVRIRREIQIMSSVQHPNIIHIYEGIKIADFGLSNVFNEQRLLNTFCGSPLYASPEIVKGTPYHGPEVDCWSLGVLLYTLVYGAMPFDGSNFKRLVKQISQGDYFEPKKPSSASPLIREMLTVTPARRANIEKICAHWWVNEGHTESCLDIAEELANQTPVRLDLLLSLAPPPPAVGSDMILTDEKAAGDSQTAHSDAVAPARCHSVGSLMDLDQPSAERKIQEFERHKQKGSAGDGISTEIVPSGAKKKEWCRRSNSQSRPASVVEEKSPEEKMEIDADVSEPQSSEASKAASESLSKNEESVKKDTQLVEGAACAPSEATSTESAEQKSPGAESSKASIGRDKTTRKSVKGSPKKSKPATASSTDNVPSSMKMSPNKEEELKGKTKVEEEVSVNNTEGPVAASSESSKEKTSEEISVSDAVKQKVKKKKKVTGSKSEETVTESVEKKVDSESSLIALNSKPEDSSSQEAKMELKKEATDAETNENTEAHSSKDSSVKTADTPKAGSVKAKKSRADLNLGKLGSSSEKSSGSEDLVSPTKTVERRRSKIFENSDQFNIFLKGSEQKPAENKPKKVFIPGVKVSDYKQAFERRSSVTPSSSQSPLKPSASKKAVDSSSGTAPCDLSPSEGTKSSEVPSSSTDSTLNSSAQILETSSKSQEENASSTETQSSKNIDQNSVEPSSNASKPEMNSTHNEATELAQPSKDEEAELELVPALQVTDKMSQQEKARIKKLKDAVDVISNAIAEETRKESGDALPVRKISTGKPPVPMSPEKSKSKGVASAKSPPVTPSEKKSMKIPTSPGAAAAEITENSGESSQKGVEATSEPESEKATPAKKKSAKVEITLKSATLPRRRTSKAEIQLGYPPSKIPESGPAGEYRTEVEHMVGSSNPARLQTQRSEVAFPVAAATNVQPLSFRSASLEPEGTPKAKGKPKEHIIPIRLESEREENRPQSLHQTPPPARPPVPPVQTQRSISQRSSSLSRQSTQDSDTDSTISASGPEPIRKSPREFIIPIAVEGGGYVTPRAGSLEPSLSEASTETSQQHRRSGRSSSRLRKMGPTLEHNDSLSSAEEEDDDDDDGFEILTAESLFSTLLSRVSENVAIWLI
ncbi:hypothetical protein C0J52_01505 [Blattella germanica]|nr:hypothetical protein C0J52_01505 [Blattella germanica]